MYVHKLRSLDSKQYKFKKLLNDVFVIFGIIKVKVIVISRS